MNILIVYLGSFYLVIGTVFLIVPLIYLELGRPKDFLKAFFNLLIGLIFIIKNKTIDESYLLIFFLLTLIIVFYVLELFSYRWNQLTDKEKNRLITFGELKSNLSKIIAAINLGVRNLTKPLNFLNFKINNQNIISKKWVRNDKNDNIKV
tara:strand:+ start:61 stop:510 length:450 start_codon:yes stop_codon:yes gene_type:complete